VVFLNLFSIWLSWTYNLGYEFFKLTWVDLPHITHVICVLCYLRLTQAPPSLSKFFVLSRFFFRTTMIFIKKNPQALQVNPGYYAGYINITIPQFYLDQFYLFFFYIYIYIILYFQCFFFLDNHDFFKRIFFDNLLSLLIFLSFN
jgi:hypothetical protein